MCKSSVGKSKKPDEKHANHDEHKPDPFAFGKAHGSGVSVLSLQCSLAGNDACYIGPGQAFDWRHRAKDPAVRFHPGPQRANKRRAAMVAWLRPLADQARTCAWLSGRSFPARFRGAISGRDKACPSTISGNRTPIILAPFRECTSAHPCHYFTAPSHCLPLCAKLDLGNGGSPMGGSTIAVVTNW